MKITIAHSLEAFIAGKKGTTILTLKVKVRKTSCLAQKTTGVLCWNLSYHHSIGRVLLGFMEDLDSASISQQFVRLLFPLPLRSVRPPRNMCGDVEFHDFGWMKGVLCQDTSDAIKPTPSIVAWVQPRSRTMCVKWLARFKEGANIEAVWVPVHDHPAAGVKESSSHWLEDLSSDSQAWP